MEWMPVGEAHRAMCLLDVAHHLIESTGKRVVLMGSNARKPERVDERDLRNVARFTGDFTEPLALCINRGPARMRVREVLCVHWREALGEFGLVLSARVRFVVIDEFQGIL